MDITYEIIRSWNDTDGNVNSMQDIMNWIEERKKNLHVNIEKVDFSYNGFWYYDENTGYIRNENNSFFQLAGYQEIENDRIIGEQPLIIQNEIGYLGIICKMIDGELNFLIQAKIEPGNVNVIQLSPTIQATKSNFTRQHGGQSPDYLNYFINSSRTRILADQIQSEQASRFYKKRNRNIIILAEEEVPVLDSHRWMTLGQIKECMKMDNLVNMDTRTVISCLPFDLTDTSLAEAGKLFKDEALFRSIFSEPDKDEERRIFNVLNDRKMFRRDKSRLLPLRSLKGWKMTDKEIVCRTPYDFKVIYCRIEIEGREVNYWEQPLFEACGISVIGTFSCVIGGVRKYLVRVSEEMGCFDTAELGPLVQLGPTADRKSMTELEKLFMDKLEKADKNSKEADVILSEEGGRFYHEENRNVLLEIDEKELPALPSDHFFVDLATLSDMIRFNNCVNIQLRNLISLITIK